VATEAQRFGLAHLFDPHRGSTARGSSHRPKYLEAHKIGRAMIDSISKAAS
jgi:hypothetical protein